MNLIQALQQVDWSKGQELVRASEPGVHYDLDGAEGVRFWRMDAEADELTEHSFSAAEIFADDWAVQDFDPERYKKYGGF